jgi:hypothetical protein
VVLCPASPSSATRPIDAALREYETQRCDRVRDLVLKARKRCDITHGKDIFHRRTSPLANIRGGAVSGVAQQRDATAHQAAELPPDPRY